MVQQVLTPEEKQALESTLAANYNPETFLSNLVSTEELEKAVGGGYLSSFSTSHYPSRPLQAAADARKEEIFKKRAELIRQLNESLAEEQAALGKFKGMIGQREMTMEQQLQAGLEGIEARTDIAQRGVGEEFARRNLLRSSFAQRAQQDVALAGQAEKTAAITQVEAEKRAGRTALQKVEEQVEQRKEQTQFDLDIADLQQMIEERQKLELGDIQARFQQELAKLQLDAMQKQGMTQALGGMVQTGAMLTAAFAS